MNKEYTVHFSLELGCGDKISSVGYVVAKDTEELHSKMYPYSYDILGVKRYIES